MKVCEICGEEIDTRDADNRCEEHQETETPSRRTRLRRKLREEALRSLGLKKVRGALGGVYWE